MPNKETLPTWDETVDVSLPTWDETVPEDQVKKKEESVVGESGGSRSLSSTPDREFPSEVEPIIETQKEKLTKKVHEFEPKDPYFNSKIDKGDVTFGVSTYAIHKDMYDTASEQTKKIEAIQSGKDSDVNAVVSSVADKFNKDVEKIKQQMLR